MTRHFPFPHLPGLSSNGTSQQHDGTTDGARAVGILDDLAPATRTAVLYLRLWCDLGPAAIETAFAAQLGARHGAMAAGAFHDLCLLCLTGSDRPIMRHHATCPCVGADEARFAALVDLAAAAPREDALAHAFAMVRADLAPQLVMLATQAGLAIRRAILLTQGASATRH